MGLIRLATALAATLVGLSFAAPANAATLSGKYLQSCPAAVHAQVDPIAARGDAASDHDHTESGSKAFSSTMSTSGMYAGGTTCHLRENHSAYWAPVYVGADGTHYTASMTTYYAANFADTNGIAGGRIQPFPTGWRALFKRGVNSTVRWRCGDSPNLVFADQPSSSQCAGSDTVDMEFDTVNICWNGMDLDSSNHMSHFAADNAGSCPADYKIRLPQLQIAFRYPIAALSGKLDSDHAGSPGSSAHFDLWEAQDPAQQDVLTRCLNDVGRSTSATCGTFTYTSTNPGTPYEQVNPWLYLLERWAPVIGYVQADGQPNWGQPIPSP